MAPSEPPTAPRRSVELVLGLISILLGIAVVAAVPQLRHCVSLCLDGSFDALRGYIRSLGLGGTALLLALMLAHAILLYPSEIVTATAAYAYGFLPGLGFVLVGWLAAALLSYLLGRAVGGPLLRALLGRRFVRLEQGVERGGTSLLLSGRLIPIVPFALLGYVAGATGVSVVRFSWTTVVGYLPLTTAVAYLGSRAQTLSPRDPLVWVAAGALIAAIVGERVLSHRRH